MATINRRNSSPKGRGQRKGRESLKAREIFASGQSIPGLLSPSGSDMVSDNSPAGKKGLGRPPEHAVGPVVSDTPSSQIESPGENLHMPSFGRDTIAIYSWPGPIPVSFTQLTRYHRRWKESEDLKDKATDVDDGADDWDAFAGPFIEGEDNTKLLYNVASVFVKRAKRAFWADKSWTNFEKEELEAKTDEEELPNVVRLAVFDRLKVRLCEEIWSQVYQIPQDSKVPSPEAEEKNTAGLGTSVCSGTSNDRPVKRPRLLPPTATQAAKGITGMALDSWGTYQPLYEDETEPPSMDSQMADFRERKRQHSDELEQGVRTTAHTHDRIRYAQVGGVFISKQQVAQPTFEMSMEQAQEDMKDSDEEDGDQADDSGDKPTESRGADTAV